MSQPDLPRRSAAKAGGLPEGRKVWLVREPDFSAWMQRGGESERAALYNARRYATLSGLAGRKFGQDSGSLPRGSALRSLASPATVAASSP